MKQETSGSHGWSSIRKGRIIGAIIGMLYMPFGFYLWYLVLKHIQATDLMWFVWIISVPLAIVLKTIKDILGED